MPAAQSCSPPHPVDVHVGQRMRALRRAARLSLDALAHEAGVAFQQLQKYEQGVNRISASRLYLLAGALRCTVADFYAGLPLTQVDGGRPDPLRAELDRLVARRGGPEVLAGLSKVPDELLPLVADLVAAVARQKPEGRSNAGDLAPAA